MSVPWLKGGFGAGSACCGCNEVKQAAVFGVWRGWHPVGACVGNPCGSAPNVCGVIPNDACPWGCDLTIRRNKISFRDTVTWLGQTATLAYSCVWQPSAGCVVLETYSQDGNYDDLVAAFNAGDGSECYIGSGSTTCVQDAGTDGPVFTTTTQCILFKPDALNGQTFITDRVVYSLDSLVVTAYLPSGQRETQWTTSGDATPDFGVLEKWIQSIDWDAIPPNSTRVLLAPDFCHLGVPPQVHGLCKIFEDSKGCAIGEFTDDSIQPGLVLTVGQNPASGSFLCGDCWDVINPGEYTTNPIIGPVGMGRAEASLVQRNLPGMYAALIVVTWVGTGTFCVADFAADQSNIIDCPGIMPAITPGTCRHLQGPVIRPSSLTVITPGTRISGSATAIYLSTPCPC